MTIGKRKSRAGADFARLYGPSAAGLRYLSLKQPTSSGVACPQRATRPEGRPDHESLSLKFAECLGGFVRVSIWLTAITEK